MLKELTGIKSLNRDEQHYQVLVELGGEKENLHLMDTRYQQLPYLARTKLRTSRKSSIAGNRTKSRKGRGMN